MSLVPVVVTGMGVISPLGLNCQDLMSALLAGTSAVARYADLERVGGLRSRLAARVTGVDPQQVPRKIRRSMSLMSIYAYLASRQALAMAEWPEAGLATGRLGVGPGG